jgi:hypothetical protein
VTSRVIAFVLAIGILACRNGEPSGLGRDTFIDVVVQLRRAAVQYPDSALFDAHRAEILREAGVTDSMMNTFVARHNRDVQFMTEVWDSVDRRLNPPPSTESPDTVH